MNSLKPLILMIVLGGVAFGVYRSLTRGPAELPPGVDPSAIDPVNIQLPDVADNRSAKTADGPKVLAPSGEAPKYKPLPITPADTARTGAPPFQSTFDTNKSPAASAPPFDSASQPAATSVTLPFCSESPRPN